MIRIALIVLVYVLASVSLLAQDAATVAHGQKVYATQKCAICHSVGGVGNKKGLMDGVGAKLSAEEIRQWIVSAPEMTAKTKSARKPAMKAYTTLAKDDLDGLVAYLQSLKK